MLNSIAFDWIQMIERVYLTFKCMILSNIIKHALKLSIYVS